METAFSLSEAEIEDRDSFASRMFGDVLATFNIFSIFIGDQLGYYGELAKGQKLTSAELAKRTGTQERYAREWLEYQATSCILEAEDSRNGTAERHFGLAPGRAEVLVNRDSLNYMAPLAQLLVGAVQPLDQLLGAYRGGGGVPYSDYGVNLREGQANMNRPMFLHLLGAEWLPAVSDVDARLRADPPARVADIGCGAGWSCIGIAQGYPNVQVDGYDLDQASVELANRNIQEAGLSDRVHVHWRDGSDPQLHGRYDLVVAFECVHDMFNPVGVLSMMRNLAGKKGSVIIMDERTLDTFQPCAESLEQFLYGFSILHCLPAGMAEQPSAGTGTVMRADTLRGYAKQAGFGRVEILPIDNFFFRFYRLRQ